MSGSNSYNALVVQDTSWVQGRCIYQEIISQVNPNAHIVCDEQRLRPEKSEVNRLLGCNAKIKELTDWKQQYTFEQGIAETIAWIRQHMDDSLPDRGVFP